MPNGRNDKTYTPPPQNLLNLLSVPSIAVSRRTLRPINERTLRAFKFARAFLAYVRDKCIRIDIDFAKQNQIYKCVRHYEVMSNTSSKNDVVILRCTALIARDERRESLRSSRCLHEPQSLRFAQTCVVHFLTNRQIKTD